VEGAIASDLFQDVFVAELKNMGENESNFEKLFIATAKT